ncbi:MAG TPA: ABC transporter permease, partial [Candidatus Limnocylindrales bacterium]
FFASVSILPIGGGREVDFLVPGILALAVISTSLVNLGIATAYERSYGVLKRLGGSPLSRPGLIAAKLAAVALVEVLQVAILVAVAVALYGWSPGRGWSPLLVAIALTLGTLAFAGLGLAMAGGLRAEATLAFANGLFLVLLLLGGIVLPIDHLPAVLADIARLLPATALSDALRIGFGADSGSTGASAAGSLALLAAWAIGAIAVAARTFRWE